MRRMPKGLEKWTVFPHGAIEKISENLWRVEARMPKAPISRTMLVARLRDGRLVIHNGIALGEPEMKELESWGTPSFLIVPNAAHRLDARIFKERYPAIQVIGPAGGKEKIEQVVKVDATQASFGDDAVRYEMLDGTAEREGVLVVKSNAGTTLVFTDVVMNMRSVPGFSGFMMGLVGFTGPKPKVTSIARMIFVKDKKALKAELERRAETPGLTRVEVAHGAPITESPGDGLRAAASGL
jgi:hypothetical protein